MADADTEVMDIYRALKKGLGHERVTDANVDGLIALAAQDGHLLLQTELREWRSPCDENALAVPTTVAPTRGFNKDNAKH